MKLTELKQKANEIAETYGIKKENVTVMASIFGVHNGEMLSYTCQAWVSKISKHVSNKGIESPEIALIAFKDALEFNLKEYESEKKDIEI